MTLASWEIFYLLIWQVTFQCQFYSLSGCGCSSFLKRVERYEPDIGTLLSAHVLSEGKVLKKDAEAVACDSEDAYCFLMWTQQGRWLSPWVTSGKRRLPIVEVGLVVGRVLPLLCLSPQLDLGRKGDPGPLRTMIFPFSRRSAIG